MTNVRTRLLQRLLVHNQHTCPWWFAYTFDNPIRGLVHNPRVLLAGLVKGGDTVVDLGCGMGFFSMGLAELVGPEGRVIAVDLQAEMLRRAERRARRRGLADRIEFHQCAPDAIGISVEADFALAFWMLHEVRQRHAFLTEIRSFLRPTGHLLVAEPRGHVPERLFDKEMSIAREAGFEVSEGPKVRFSRSAVFVPGGNGVASLATP